MQHQILTATVKMCIKIPQAGGGRELKPTLPAEVGAANLFARGLVQAFNRVPPCVPAVEHHQFGARLKWVIYIGSIRKVVPSLSLGHPDK